MIRGGSIVNYGGFLGFMRFLIIHPQFRGRNFGHQLRIARLDRLIKRLDAPVRMEMNGVFNMQSFSVAPEQNGNTTRLTNTAIVDQSRTASPKITGVQMKETWRRLDTCVENRNSHKNQRLRVALAFHEPCMKQLVQCDRKIFKTCFL